MVSASKPPVSCIAQPRARFLHMSVVLSSVLFGTTRTAHLRSNRVKMMGCAKADVEHIVVEDPSVRDAYGALGRDLGFPGSQSKMMRRGLFLSRGSLLRRRSDDRPRPS